MMSRSIQGFVLLWAITLTVGGCASQQRPDDRWDDPTTVAEGEAAAPPRERAPALGLMRVAPDVESVVYVIDASGSLIDTLPFVIHELGVAIGQLRPDQRFAALFYNDEQIVEMPPAGLVAASDANKAAAALWLDASGSVVVPMGGSHPVAVFARARALEPDVVIVLADRIEGVGHRSLDVDAMRNEAHKFAEADIAVHTIQWIYPDPVESFGGVPALKRLADDTGGSYRYVSGRDLGLE